jgi:UTP--glucose-1-phosphate uridylyltransferase
MHSTGSIYSISTRRVRLVLLRMNAIHRAGVHAGRVFGADAGFRNYVCHVVSESLFIAQPLPETQLPVAKGPFRRQAVEMPAKVRKAVFPAAGLGTRFLPATKAQPKEMLPIVDKPIIQYGVEEALHSGIQNIIIVTGRGKSAIEDHFDVSFELEYLLESRKKKDLLAIVRGISDMINVSYVRQKEALGLGHAVLRASELVGDEPFAVVLADDVIEAETPCLRQLLDIYEFFSAPVLAVMEVPRESISSYGCIDADPVIAQRQQRPVYRIRDLVEKPKASDAPSNLAIIGRYVLTPDIFESLQTIDPGSGGEIQLTDADSPSAAQPAHLRLPVRGHALRRGRQAGIPESHGGVALRRHDLGRPFRGVSEGGPARGSESNWVWAEGRSAARSFANRARRHQSFRAAAPSRATPSARAFALR